MKKHLGDSRLADQCSVPEGIVTLILIDAVSRHVKDKKVSGNSHTWICQGQTVPYQ